VNGFDTSLERAASSRDDVGLIDVDRLYRSE
jgi:hypothetical protein